MFLNSQSQCLYSIFEPLLVENVNFIPFAFWGKFRYGVKPKPNHVGRLCRELVFWFFFSLRLNFNWEHVITLEILYLQVPITVLTWCWSQCLHSYAYLSSTCLSLAPGTRCTFQRRLRRFVLKMLTDLSSTTHRQNIYCCCGFFLGTSSLQENRSSSWRMF